MAAKVIPQTVRYGLWDTKHKCWMGNEAGPISHISHRNAKLAAAILSQQFGDDTLRRIRALPLPSDPLTKTGQEDVIHDSEKAIDMIEARAKETPSE